MNNRKKAPEAVIQDLKKLDKLGIPIKVMAKFAEVSVATVYKYLNKKIDTNVAQDTDKEKTLELLKLYAWIISESDVCAVGTGVKSIAKLVPLLHSFLSLKKHEDFIDGAICTYNLMNQSRFSIDVQEEYKSLINALFPPEKIKIYGKQQLEAMLKKMHCGEIAFPDAVDINSSEKVCVPILKTLVPQNTFGTYFDDSFVTMLQKVMKRFNERLLFDIQHHHLIVHKHPSYQEDRAPGTVRASYTKGLKILRSRVMNRIRTLMPEIEELEIKLSWSTEELQDIKKKYADLEHESNTTLMKVISILQRLHKEKPQDRHVLEMLTFLKVEEDNGPKGNLYIPVIDLDLSVRALNLLKHFNVEFLWEVTKLDVEDLLQSRNCGKKTVKEIQDMLKRHNLSFGMKLSH